MCPQKRQSPRRRRERKKQRLWVCWAHNASTQIPNTPSPALRPPLFVLYHFNSRRKWNTETNVTLHTHVPTIYQGLPSSQHLQLGYTREKTHKEEEDGRVGWVTVMGRPAKQEGVMGGRESVYLTSLPLFLLLIFFVSALFESLKSIIITLHHYHHHSRKKISIPTH